MKDSKFKELDHRVGAYQVVSRSTEVAKGYKPDVTVEDTNKQLAFILECEQKTDRKAFLGDLVKAEKHAEERRACPVLVIVMEPLPNSTVQQIADHLAPYAKWLAHRNGGTLCLSGVLIMSDDEYERSFQANELLTSQEFRARATVVA